jgi:dihydrolipoamide dehydrogenase
LIVGAGAIGVEFASFYRDLGAEVTLVEMLPRILPQEDEEISAAAAKIFARRGIKLHTEATLREVSVQRDGVTAVVDLGDGQESPLTVDRILLATGITGNVEDLGLDATKVVVDRGHVVVDEWLRTAEQGVYAIGDLVGPPWLAHKASHEALVCVGRIAGDTQVRPLDVSRVPSCTYSRPQVASVGLTEAAAREAGHEVRVGRFPVAANGKAAALGEREGLVKTVFDANSGELLGAHMLGPEVTELIQGFVLARTLEATEADLIEAIYPHPTLSEMMHEAVLDAFGRVLNV